MGMKLTVTEIEGIAGCSRRRALDIAQRSSSLGLGNFRAGRRGHDSRVEWLWTTKKNAAVIFAEPQPQPEPPPSPDIMADIATAKAELSGKLGVPEAAIEISIWI